MVTKAKSVRTWLAVVALGVLAVELLAVELPAVELLDVELLDLGLRAVGPLGRGATAATAPLSSRPAANAAFDVSEPAAPASLHARVVALEARSEELAAQLARARRELSDL